MIENSKRNSTENLWYIGVGYYNLRRFGGKKVSSMALNFIIVFPSIYWFVVEGQNEKENIWCSDQEVLKSFDC